MALSELLEPILRLSSFTRRNLKIKSLGLWIHLAQTLQASQPVLAWTFLMRKNTHAIIQKLHAQFVRNPDLQFVYQTLLFPNDSVVSKYQSLWQLSLAEILAQYYLLQKLLAVLPVLVSQVLHEDAHFLNATPLPKPHRFHSLL